MRSSKTSRLHPSREGTLACRSAIRVKAGEPTERWPRASSRPRWPDDAKNPHKNGDGFFSTRQSRCWEAGRMGSRSAGARPRRGLLGKRPRCRANDAQKHGTNLERTPSGQGRPGRAQTGRAPEARDPVRPDSSVTPAHAKRDTPARQHVSTSARQRARTHARQANPKPHLLTIVTHVTIPS